MKRVKNAKYFRAYVYVLLLILCSWLPHWSAVHAHEFENWCEYRLSAPAEQNRFFEAFHNSLSEVEGNRRMTVDRLARPPALRYFSLGENDAGLTLNLEVQNMADTLRLTLSSETKVFMRRQLPLERPSLWKRFEDRESWDLPSLENGVDWSEFGFGLVIARANGMRRVLEIVRDGRGELQLALSLDVDCRFVSNYTASLDQRNIVFKDNSYLCRVPVLATNISGVAVQ